MARVRRCAGPHAWSPPSPTLNAAPILMRRPTAPALILRLLIAPALAVALVPALLPWRTQAAAEPPPKPNATPPRPSELTGHYTTMLRYHRRMDANVPDRAVVFIGDSLTQGLCTDAVAQPSVNYGIGSDTTVGVLGRLPAYADSLRRASALVLAIGVNDLLHRENPEIVANYRRILELLPPALPIVCSALLPINERTYPKPSPVTNARIHDLNTALRALCAENPRCHFVDPHDRLVDAEGNLKSALEDGDGIHLNPAGNRVWTEALQAGLQQAGAALPSQPVRP